MVDVNAGRYTAKMLTAQDTEVSLGIRCAHLGPSFCANIMGLQILIQRTDGSKTRLPLAMICEGKYQISTKS